MTPNDADDRTDETNSQLASTDAYIAVGLLADAVGPDTYRGHDIAEAVSHLQDAREAAPPNSESAERIEAALGYLSALDEYPTDRRKLRVREALAELAPVAAGISGGAPLHRPHDDKPVVPVFYDIPPTVANRAIERFKRRRERLEGGAEGRYIDQPTDLKELIWDEIYEQPVIWVGGDTLGGYASRAGVESLTIEPDDGDE